MRHASLFTGFCGFELAAEAMNWENVFACENADFPSKVIHHNYPNIKLFTDVRTTDFASYRGSIDILTGGFPCQPFSVAGLREGTDDPRYLWPHMLRAVREIRPAWVVAENVPGLITWGDGLVFEQVCADLEAENYEVLPFVLPAAGVNAPHKRERVFIIAYSSDARLESVRREPQNSIPRPGTAPDSEVIAYNNLGDRAKIGLQTGREKHVYSTAGSGDASDSECTRLQRGEQHSAFNAGQTRQQTFRSIAELYKSDYWKNFPTEPPIRSGDDGLRSRLEQYIRDSGAGILTEKEVNEIVSATIGKVRKESIKGYGNAVVPQLILSIFKAIDLFNLL